MQGESSWKGRRRIDRTGLLGVTSQGGPITVKMRPVPNSPVFGPTCILTPLLSPFPMIRVITLPDRIISRVTRSLRTLPLSPERQICHREKRSQVTVDVLRR